jgi:hypothetical protein
MLVWGLPPASDCGTPHQILWWPGLFPFALFVAAGGYTAWRGTVGQRLLLFLTTAAIVVAYILVLSSALQIAIDTERARAVNTDGCQ